MTLYHEVNMRREQESREIPDSNENDRNNMKITRNKTAKRIT
jgi:hypothetical protein